MESSLSQDLQRTFNLAALRHEARALRTPADWEKGKDIRLRYKRETNKQMQQYYADYDTRISQVVKKLMNKAGAKNRDLTHRWFGTDKFNKDALMRQAHRAVQMDHDKRMSCLTDREINELDTLIETVEQRDRLYNKPTQDFSQASNRRNGQERRIRQSRPRRR